MKTTNMLLFVLIALQAATLAVSYFDRRDNVALAEKLLSGEFTARAFERTLAKVNTIPIELPRPESTRRAEPKIVFFVESDGTVRSGDIVVTESNVGDILKQRDVCAADTVKIVIHPALEENAHRSSAFLLDAIRDRGVSRLDFATK